MSALTCAWLLLAAATPSPTATPTPSPSPTPPISILLNKSVADTAPRGQNLSDVARQVKLRLPADQPRRLDNAAVKRLAEGVELTTTKARISGSVASAGSDRLDEARKKYWQQEYANALAATANLERRVTELEGEVGRLQQDFYRWDDPAYRDGVIKPALDRALQRLAEAKKELESSRDRPQEVKARAEREGALPGWFREPLPTPGAQVPPPSRYTESAPPGVTPSPVRDATPTPASRGAFGGR